MARFATDVEHFERVVPERRDEQALAVNVDRQMIDAALDRRHGDRAGQSQRLALRLEDGRAELGMLAISVSAAPRPASGAPPGACSLLTQAQVQAALGVTIGATPVSTGKICQWQGPRGKPGMRQMAVVTIQDANAFALAKKPSTSPTLVKTAVTGVGDDAVFNTIGVVTTTLTVKTGDVYFEVHVYGFSEPQTKAMEKTLALEIVQKLH